MQKVKDFLSLIFGWIVAAALVVFWFLNRRRSVPTTPHIEPKEVPETDEEVIKAAEKAGILKSSGSASMLGRR